MIHIGTVPYLNARPLVDWFSMTPEGQGSGVSVVDAVPSALPGLLESGEIAAALVSSIERFRHPEWVHAPGVSIAADGPVESVRLLSKTPIERIRRVALDTSSLTSTALLKILMAERYEVEPEYVAMPPDLAAMLAESDAALLIGDAGYRRYPEPLVALDLGAAWKAWTGLPFVYALWLGPSEALTAELSALLLQAKEWGVAHFDVLTPPAAARHGESVERVRHYFTDLMRYDLGPQEMAGLNLFGEKLREHGLA